LRLYANDSFHGVQFNARQKFFVAFAIVPFTFIRPFAMLSFTTAKEIEKRTDDLLIQLLTAFLLLSSGNCHTKVRIAHPEPVIPQSSLTTTTGPLTQHMASAFGLFRSERPQYKQKETASPKVDTVPNPMAYSALTTVQLKHDAFHCKLL
jgi:hypothetical protein